MKRILLVFAVFPLLMPAARADIAGGAPAAIMAKQVPPQPPANNPHSPITEEDRKRVEFAVAEIQAYYGTGIVEIRHPHIIPWAFQNFLNNRQQQPPIAEVAAEPMPAMAAPQLRPDEYMVHAYVKFAHDPRWFHLDVIMSEDSSGRLTRRNFFSIPIPTSSSQLPHGVVC